MSALKVMGVQLSPQLIQAVKLRAITEKKTYSEWVAAALESALCKSEGLEAAAAPDMLMIIARMQQRLDVLERRTTPGEQMTATNAAEPVLPHGLPGVDPMTYGELITLLKQRILGVLKRSGPTGQSRILGKTAGLKVLLNAIDEAAARNEPDPRTVAVKELLQEGLITVERSSNGCGVMYSLNEAPPPPTTTDEQAELIDVFNVLSEALGDAEIEIRLSQPLRTQVIDIWIPAAKLALMLATKYNGMNGGEKSTYHAELEGFAPGARSAPVSTANIHTIAARILSPTTPEKKELASKTAHLDPRQREVIELLAKGFTNKQVAAMTGYRWASVKSIAYRYGAGGASEKLRATVKGIITSPGFALRYKSKTFEARDIVSLLTHGPRTNATYLVSAVLKFFATEGLIGILPRGKYGNKYFLK